MKLLLILITVLLVSCKTLPEHKRYNTQTDSVGDRK